MDNIDKEILNELQADSQISNQELADRVALSPSPCSRRVKQLEDAGYIEKYVAILNPKKVGLPLSIIVLVGLDSHEAKTMSNFEKCVEALPEVVQCYLIAGQQADYMLKVVVPDLDSSQRFLLKKLTTIKGASNIRSSFVLRNVIEKTTLPLDHLS